MIQFSGNNGIQEKLLGLEKMKIRNIFHLRQDILLTCMIYSRIHLLMILSTWQALSRISASIFFQERRKYQPRLMLLGSVLCHYSWAKIIHWVLTNILSSNWNRTVWYVSKITSKPPCLTPTSRVSSLTLSSSSVAH